MVEKLSEQRNAPPTTDLNGFPYNSLEISLTNLTYIPVFSGPLLLRLTHTLTVVASSSSNWFCWWIFLTKVAFTKSPRNQKNITLLAKIIQNKFPLIIARWKSTIKHQPVTKEIVMPHSQTSGQIVSTIPKTGIVPGQIWVENSPKLFTSIPNPAGLWMVAPTYHSMGFLLRLHFKAWYHLMGRCVAFWFFFSTPPITTRGWRF